MFDIQDPQELGHSTKPYLLSKLTDARTRKARELVQMKAIDSGVLLATRDAQGVYKFPAADSAGVFSILQTESFDPLLHLPLQSFTYNRDADFRTDVSLGTDATSFTLQNFTGSNDPYEPNWANDIAIDGSTGAVDSGKTTTPVWDIVHQARWSVFELARGQLTGMAIDTMQLERLNREWQQKLDYFFYLGSTKRGVKGLLNWTTGSKDGSQPGITPVAASTKAAGGTNWIKADGTLNATPLEILADVRAGAVATYVKSGLTIYPEEVLIDPYTLNALTVPLSISGVVGAISILEYLRQNSPSISFTGKPLEFRPVKWLTGSTLDADFASFNASGTTTGRLVFRTKGYEHMRLPKMDLQGLNPQFIGTNQVINYVGKLGGLEIPRPEVMYYMDGV